MGDPYQVYFYMNALTPGGTLVVGPGPQGEPTLDHQLTLEIVPFSSSDATASIAGLMLLGPNDFEDHPPLGLGAKFQFPFVPEGIDVSHVYAAAVVHAQLLYPGTVYQIEASP